LGEVDVKMKLRTMMLATASVLGSLSVAQAQPAPTSPDSAATPPTPPAPADPNVPSPADPNAPSPTAAPQPSSASANTAQQAPSAPAFAPLAPTPAAAPPAAVAPGPDQTSKKDSKPQETASAQLGLGGPSPIRLSWFSWQQNASTKIFGIGRDYIGTNDESYSWDFAFTPRYSFINEKDDWAWVNLNIGWTVELTNSDTTTKQNQVLFNDLGVGLGYRHFFYRSEDDETSLFVGPLGSVTLPTSLASQNHGTYMNTSLGAGLGGNVKILGHESDWFPSIFVSSSASWRHLFARSYIPTKSDLDWKRQSASGSTLLSDQLSGVPFAMNTAAFNLGYYLTIYKELSFGNVWSLQVPFRHDFEAGGGTGCDASTLTDPCVTAQRNPNRSLGTPVTSFDVSLGYIVAGLAWVSVGYNNTTPQLGPDGQRRNVFYSPDSQFYLSTILFMDSIYNKLKPQDEKKAAAMLKQKAAQGIGGMFATY